MGQGPETSAPHSCHVYRTPPTGMLTAIMAATSEVNIILPIGRMDPQRAGETCDQGATGILNLVKETLLSLMTAMGQRRQP